MAPFAQRKKRGSTLRRAHSLSREPDPSLFARSDDVLGHPSVPIEEVGSGHSAEHGVKRIDRLDSSLG
jgi:hypothetical protein